MSGKYTPLEQYLRGISETQKELTMSFVQVEQIINDKLPPSAYQYQAWWANQKEGSHVEAFAWMDAGWLVDTVNFTEKWVRLVRK